MKLKGIFILTILFLSLLSCGERLQPDIFLSMRENSLFSDNSFSLLNGGVENSCYDLVLTLNSEERNLIKAMVWSLEDGSGEVISSKTDTVDAQTREWPSNFIFKWTTDMLVSDDYKLKITVYSDFTLEADGGFSFSNARYKRVFVHTFFIGIPELNNEVQVVSLKESDDTGISNSDRVTQKNSELTIIGKTTIADELLQKSGTEIFMVIAGMEAKNKLVTITSQNLLDPALLGEGNGDAREWSWTTPTGVTLLDGKYSVLLSVKYIDTDGSTKTLKNANAFVLTIDTVAPELYWRYLYNGTALVTNSAKIPVTDSDPIYEANWDFISSYGGTPDKDKKKDFERLATYDSKDFSEIFPLEGETNIYVGANFTASENGFEPYCAGTQRLFIRGRDLAGNICQEIVRKVKVREPHSLNNYDSFTHGDDPNHPMYNNGFQVAQGIMGFDNSEPNNYTIGDAEGADNDDARPAGKFPGWKADDLWYRTQSDKEYFQNAYEKCQLDNNEQSFWWIEYSGWESRNFFYTIIYGNSGEKGFRFATWAKLKSNLFSSGFLRGTSGFLYKEVIFYQGVHYDVKGYSKPDKGGSIVAKTAVVAVTNDLANGDSLVGGESSGLFKICETESENARDGYHYALLPTEESTMGSATLSVTAKRSDKVKIGFVKDSGYNAGGAIVDDLTVNFTFNKTSDY